MWIPGMHSELEDPEQIFIFLFNVLLEWPLVLPTCPSLQTIPSGPLRIPSDRLGIGNGAEVTQQAFL